MFSKILIANRGEIACRVIRAAKRYDIQTVAVYSESDRDAMHVCQADEAYFIGPAPAAQSYLKFEAIVSIAQETGTEAIHPGYGFLAENAEFADACAEAGIVFIGPPASAIRTMGDKAAAKTIMERAGVPVTPGYHGKDQKAAKLLAEAEKIGWPVLLKASAGGGGKGMRIVRGKKEFNDALGSAKREAKSAFGDDRMLVEKYIEKPRHIEVQVFGDSHGNVVHLFERDCSVQRRHQKVIEEAPAPGVSGEWRARICEAAVSAASAVDYNGAGTVEFIVETGPDGAPGEFWFMEMNTRLQVEHPVTEMITGADLVEWQFRVAAGGKLPLVQDDIGIAGHAVEARIYAEDPARDFLPAPGRIAYAALPCDAPEIRVDHGGVGPGVTIPPDYDPMIAKIIASGGNRADAIGNLREALGRTHIAGVATNTEFLSRVLDHPEFRSGGVDTGLIDRNADTLLPPAQGASSKVLALACLGLLRQQRRGAADRALKSRDPWSPWARAEGWRLNDTGHTVLRFIDNGVEVDIPCRFEPGGYRLELPDGAVTATLDEATHDAPPPQPLPRKRERGSIEREAEIKPSPARAGEGWEGVGASPVLVSEDMGVELNGSDIAATVVRDRDTLHIFHEGGHWTLGIHDPLSAAEAHEGASGGLTAPMPGKVAAVHVKAGDAVLAGQPLLVVEAMKMEHTIHAPADGAVTEVRFKSGDQVQEGEVLVVVEESAADA